MDTNTPSTAVWVILLAEDVFELSQGMGTRSYRRLLPGFHPTRYDAQQVAFHMAFQYTPLAAANRHLGRTVVRKDPDHYIVNLLLRRPLYNVGFELTVGEQLLPIPPAQNVHADPRH